ELRDGACLGREPVLEADARRICEARRCLEHLEGDRALERDLNGAVDDREPPLGHLPLDAIAARQCRARETEPIGGGAHATHFTTRSSRAASLRRAAVPPENASASAGWRSSA